MLQTNDHLRPCLRVLQRLTGARAVSLFLPGGGGATTPVWIHEGEPPVTELADPRVAMELARQGGSGPEAEADPAWLRSSPGSAAGSWIVRVSTPAALLSRLDDACATMPSPARRSADAARGAPTAAALSLLASRNP